MQDRKRAWRVAAAWVVGLGFAGAAPAQTLSFELVGGAGSGDGGAALQANLANAGDAEYDGAGNLYVVQEQANRIRRIAPNGTITTVVGGTQGYAGDGGQASQARIGKPRGIAFDNAGNLYFADSANFRVRRITPSGVISTVAGSGLRTSSGDGGHALSAGFASVDGVAVDGAGNLYISEYSGHRVRKVATNGVISTYAGNGAPGYGGDNGAATSAMLQGPLGLDVDAAGNLYIADNANHAIRRVSTGGTIISYAVLNASAYPVNVHVDSAGAVYAADVNTCQLLRWTAPGGVPILVAGIGGCGPTSEGAAAAYTKIGAPDGIALDPQGNVVFVDSDMSRVRRVVAGSGLIQTIAGSGGEYADGIAASGAPMSFLFGVSVDAAGNVLVADAGYRRVRRISPARVIDSPAGNGWWNEILGCPGGASSCNAKTFPLTVPWGVIPGSTAGQILVSDRAQDQIYAIANGAISKYAGGYTLAWGADGPADQARIDPYGMVRSASGDLYFADNRSNKVRRLNAGMITTLAGTGAAGSTGDGGPATSATLDGPMAIAVDGTGRVYVSEFNGRRVRRFTPNGTIQLFAGNGQAGVSGDGGPATAAALGRIDGIAVHGNEVYIASEGRLRRVDASGVISTVQNWTQYASGLFVAGNMLYIGTFEGQVYRAALAPPARRARHDYDGNGRSDILWRNGQTGANVVWKAANGGTPMAVTTVTNQTWKIVAQGDFDGDGKDDIFWRNAGTGANTIWRAANGGAPIAVATAPLEWVVAGAGDFDSDGKADIAWRNNRTGANVLWRSGNAATPSAVTGVSNLQWMIAGVGDFDGDGRADLLWRNTVTGANTIWRSANNTTQIAVATAANLAWKIQSVGDYDGDGRDDIFWRNTSTGQNLIWNRGASANQRVLASAATSWRVVASGDYDGNGVDDLLWRNTGNGTNAVWKSGNAATPQAVATVASQAWTVVPKTGQ